jgi:hypothetical protein
LLHYSIFNKASEGELHMPNLLRVCYLFCLMASALEAQSQYIRGVEYREITDLKAPRVAMAQPQLGGVTSRVAQYAPPNTWNTPVQSQVITPADQRPALNNALQPISSNRAAYNQPYAYGYGHVNGCSWGQPTGYRNYLPPPQTVQPISYQQPQATLIQPGGMQPTTGNPFNPFAEQPKQVPLRPIVPIRSMPVNYEIGQGIIGQPKIYVPNQPLRNMIRYITP